MSVVSARSDLRLDNGGLGSFREWVATAATQDTATGGTVTITITQTASGTPGPPNQADTLTLDVWVDNTSTLIRSFTLNPASASQTVSLVMTDTGAAGGQNRLGTLRLSLHAVNTSAALSASRYNVDADLTNNTPPTGYTVTTHDQGWVRSTSPTGSTVLAGAGLLGYSDTLTATTTLAAPSFIARTVTVTLAPLTTVTSSSSTSGTFTSALGAVDNRFPASSANRSTVTALTNAALTGQPWTTVTTLTETTRTVDPRITFTHLMQFNDNTFGTPPGSKNITSGQRLTSDLAFLSARVTNANGLGLNGITWTTTLQDHGHLTSAQTATPTSTTQGGQDGWGNAFLAWSSALPGGQWDKSSTISSPAAATGLEAGNTATYFLVASNPNLRLLCAAGPATDTAEATHFSPGQVFLVGAVLVNTLTQQTLPLDASPAPAVLIGRFHQSLGRAEFLDSDGTWKPTNGATIYAWPLTQSVGDSNAWTLSFTGAQTASWGTFDVQALARAYYGGVPVAGAAKEATVSGLNRHDKYAFDGPGFVGFPTR